MVDCSDCGSLGSSLVLLAEVLAVARDGSKPVLLAFNKCDLTDSNTYAMFYNLLDVDSLLSRTDVNVTLLQGSFIEDSLCRAALRWMTPSNAAFQTASD